MSLNDYILNGPSRVIADDDRDPYVSWQHHLDRTNGLRGGVDLVAAVGTPILAPTDGWMDHVPNDGSAGNSCRFRHEHNPGWKDVFSHLLSYTRQSGSYFRQGEIVALSGDTGGVSPHLHRHLLDPSNTRRNPWDYFSAAPAGGGGTPLNNARGGNNMYLMRTVDGTISLVTDNGIAHIRAVPHVQLFERLFKSYPSMDTFNQAERDIMMSYIYGASQGDDADFAALAKKLDAIKVTVDTAAISKAVTDAVLKQVAEQGVQVDNAAIAAAVDATLKDDFAAIPGAVVAQEAKALGNG